MLTPDQARQLAEGFAAAITGGAIDRLDQFIHPDYVQHNAGTPPGRDGVKAYFASVVKAFPDGVATVEDVVTDGTTVVGRFRHAGTHRGEFQGLAPTGRPVEIRTIDIWRVKDGRFSEHWGETNALDLLKQLGALPDTSQAPTHNS